MGRLNGWRTAEPDESFAYTTQNSGGIGFASTYVTEPPAFHVSSAALALLVRDYPFLFSRHGFPPNGPELRFMQFESNQDGPGWVSVVSVAFTYRHFVRALARGAYPG
jgi:hypothetical protein